MNWFIYIGCAFILISGIAAGAWTTGTQQRANFYTGDFAERRLKSRISTWSFVLGLISFAVAGLIFWIN